MYARYWRTALIGNSAGYVRAALTPHSGAKQKNGRSELAQLRHGRPPVTRQKVILPELIDVIDFGARRGESTFLKIKVLTGSIRCALCRQVVIGGLIQSVGRRCWENIAQERFGN